MKYTFKTEDNTLIYTPKKRVLFLGLTTAVIGAWIYLNSVSIEDPILKFYKSIGDVVYGLASIGSIDEAFRRNNKKYCTLVDFENKKIKQYFPKKQHFLEIYRKNFRTKNYSFDKLIDIKTINETEGFGDLELTCISVQKTNNGSKIKQETVLIEHQKNPYTIEKNLKKYIQEV